MSVKRMLPVVAVVVVSACSGPGSQPPTSPSPGTSLPASAPDMSWGGGSIVNTGSAPQSGSRAVTLWTAVRSTTLPDLASLAARTPEAGLTGGGSPAPASRVTAPAGSPPAPPTNLTWGGFNDRMKGSFSFRASGPGDPPTTYVLYTLRAGDSVRQTALGLLVGYVLSGTFSPLLPGSYQMAVSARNAAGESPTSNAVSFNVTCDVFAPSAPQAFAAGANGSTVSAAWSAPLKGADPLGYVIEAGTASGQSDLTPNGIAVSETSFSYFGAPPGKYYLRVSAANACGVGAPSAEAVVTVQDSNPFNGFSGAFSGTGTNTSAAGTCTWAVTISGNATLTGTQNADGSLSGTLHVSGNYVVPDVTGTNGGKCTGATGTFDDSGAISGTTNRFTATVSTTFNKNTAFSGSALSPTLVIGTLTASYPPGSGTVVAPVTFRR